MLFLIALHDLCLATVLLDSSCWEKFNKIFKSFQTRLHNDDVCLKRKDWFLRTIFDCVKQSLKRLYTHSPIHPSRTTIFLLLNPTKLISLANFAQNYLIFYTNSYSHSNCFSLSFERTKIWNSYIKLTPLKFYLMQLAT